jgi:hypothetical protein
MFLDTEFPTPDGWAPLGLLRPGREIFAANGTLVRVGAIEPREPEHCYRIAFRDGPEIIASAGHRWHTKLAASTAKAKPRTTEQMYDDGRRMMVPRAQPWQLPEREYDIDPYILGLWLGDGDRNNATVTVAQDDLAAAIAQIEAHGYTANPTSVREDKAPLVYISVPGSHRNRFSPVRGLKVRLRDAGLLGNKHVPKDYLRGSLEQRLELLAGLMDTDGSVTPTGACCFVNANQELIDAIMELLHSFGENPVQTWVTDARSRTGGYWKVTFTPRQCIPFLMPRKVDRLRTERGREADRWIGIASITPVAPTAAASIHLDDAEQLVIVGRGAHVAYPD